MTATISNRQKTFVDYSVSGKHTIEMLEHEVKNFEALSEPSQKAIRTRFELCHQIYHMEFNGVLKGEKTLTFQQYCDFRDIIQYFSDLEKLS